MKKVIINNKVLEIYDSIDELPIVNFQKYNKYMLIDSGIGSDVDDIDNHILKIAKLMKVDQGKAIQELQNLRQCLYMVANEISPCHLAFAAILYKVDGKKVTDLSDDGLKRVLEDIRRVRRSRILDLLLKFKKKVNSELELYFPGDFSNAKEKEAYDKLRHRTLLVLDSIINENNNAEEISDIDNFMLSLHKPKSFSGSSSVEIKYDKQFENACLVIAKKTGLDARQMNTLQFYNAMENIKKQNEEEMKAVKRKGR